LKYVNGFCANEEAELNQENQKYTICLIITDGVINDMQETIDEIVRASNLPLSIIIVGVGFANFRAMETLDGGVSSLYSRNLRKYMSRDIVQFVSFRDCSKHPVKLARRVLSKIP
jgi:vacuolar-type H+-ATPase subunit F/Vma7